MKNQQKGLPRREFISSTLAGIGLISIPNIPLLGNELPKTETPISVEKSGTPPKKPKFKIADGLYDPTWDSLRKHYKCPDWFRDAKLGFWAHWGPQSQSGGGDWYTREMYIEGSRQYKHHLKKYGHPSKHGVKDIMCSWKAENFDPESLIKLYKEAGAQYFACMVNHHDNFDNWDSKYQPWNTLNIGPKKDICGLWAEAARKQGLKFGVTVHGTPDRIWNEFMPAWYGSDKEGPLKGVPYDGAVVTKADGKGTQWEGLDPRDLYGPIHKQNDPGPELIQNVLLRVDDLIRKYSPDLLYFDTTIYHSADINKEMRLDAMLGIPDYITQIAAHYYNLSLTQHKGAMEAVLNVKGVADRPYPGALLSPAVVNDFEFNDPDKPYPDPWQCDTSIGSWHYVDNDHYRSVTEVVGDFINIVANNGCMLLNIPIKGDGTMDQGQQDFVRDFGVWMNINKKAIYGSRPCRVATEYFKGPKEKKQRINLTQSKDGNTVYAISLVWPDEGRLLIRSLGKETEKARKIAKVSLLGYSGDLKWEQQDPGLFIELPANKPCEHAWSFVVDFL